MNATSLPVTVRARLITEVLDFVRQARQIPGVVRIALLGSLTTSKANPKDADLLVTVADEMDLAPLATLGRRLNGLAQRFGKNAEIFLSNKQGNYLGRICHWKDCRPGIRMSCDALHCGRRHYLHDDLKTICLSDALIAKPPIELWPQVIARVVVPQDVENLLLGPLRQQHE